MMYAAHFEERAVPPRRLVGLMGQAGVGKDTVAEGLVTAYGWHVLRFAGILKGMVSFLLNVPATKLEDREFKESPHPLLMGKTPRYAMETLGTEWGRGIIDRNLWVNATLQRALDYPGGVVIPDLRFQNEADAIRAAGGIVVQVVRPGWHSPSGHVSNQECLSIRPDLTVLNNGTDRTAFSLSAAQQIATKVCAGQWATSQ